MRLNIHRVSIQKDFYKISKIKINVFAYYFNNKMITNNFLH